MAPSIVLEGGLCKGSTFAGTACSTLRKKGTDIVPRGVLPLGVLFWHPTDTGVLLFSHKMCKTFRKQVIVTRSKLMRCKVTYFLP